MSGQLDYQQLRSIVTALAKSLDELKIDYAIMGGAAVCIMDGGASRATQDVDLVIHVDERDITAEKLTPLLLSSFPSTFAPIEQFGFVIPAYRLVLPDSTERPVEIEIFDQLAWPQRPQYNVTAATRREVHIDGQAVKLFSPEWLLREKILSQHQREGSEKEISDIQDVTMMLEFAIPGVKELDFDGSEELEAALSSFLRKQPELRELASQTIRCAKVFGDDE